MSEQVDCRVVLVTLPGQDEAGRIAGILVKEKLAACANIIPGVRSVYAWKGEICDDSEVLMILKTTARRFDALQSRMKELHPYDVPEIIALPVTAGWEPYLAWVRKETEG